MRFFNFQRLPVALVLLGAVLLPLYFFLLRPDARIAEGFSKAILLDTPQVAGQQKVGIREGELAPDFEISTVDGQRIRLSDLRGKPLVINFFALWCGSCLSEMPVINSVHEERGRESFSVLAINTGESRPRALEFIDFIQAPFTWTLDFDLTVTDAYGVRGLPQTFYLDRDGFVRAVYAGAANEARLNAYLDAAFTATAPPEFPFAIRLPLSTIPRERVLSVELREEGVIVFTSRALRCDASYCAGSAIQGLRELNGVLSLSRDARSGLDAILSVRYDPFLLSEEKLVQWLAATLSVLEDPVYTAELEVRYSARP